MPLQILVDGNNVGRKHNDAVKLSHAGIPTQAIIGCIKTARELKVSSPGSINTWLWDGKAQWRYDIHPDYKSKRNLPDPRRDANRAAFNVQRPYIWTALSLLGIRQMLAKHDEADDLAGILTANIKRSDPEAEIELISGDGDWIQLVRNGVTVRDLNDDSKIYRLDNLMDKTGYRTPFGYLEGKCLQGDGSDDIPGVGGIGEKGAPEFIAEFGGVRQFWNAVDSGAFKPKKKAHINLASPAGRAAFKRNLMIMQLIKPRAPKREDVVFDPGKLDEKAFLEFCQEHAFLSIQKDFEGFIAPFRN